MHMGTVVVTLRELGGLGGGDGLAEHGVQLDDLLVLDAAHVRRVGVGARARDVTQLAAQRAARRAPRRARRARRRQLHRRLLLLVLLALQVLLVRLHHITPLLPRIGLLAPSQK